MHAATKSVLKTACRPLAASLLGCVVASAGAADYRGFVTDGPAGLLLFQPCRGAALAASLWRVSDKSPDTALTAGATAVRQVREDRDRPLYVEFSGEQRGDGVTVLRFQRAIGHVASCGAAPKDIAPNTRLHAWSVDSDWRFVATAQGGRLDLGADKPVRFPAAAFAAASAGRMQTFDAWSMLDGGTVRVEVTEEMCLEEGSETAAGARVVLRYATTSVEGCAARF